MDDLISRQDVINAVLVSNFSACTVYGRSEEGMATAKELIQAIKNLPSAQPKQRWIPVSERLPEGGHNIIFCDSKGNVCEGVYHAIPGQWVGFRWNAIYHHDDVVAWMPLPDPYKEEE